MRLLHNRGEGMKKNIFGRFGLCLFLSGLALAITASISKDQSKFVFISMQAFIIIGIYLYCTLGTNDE